jgi:hypothetical protein
MKKIGIIIVAVCSTFTGAFAQSMLKVRLADSSQFNISVDGRYFNRRGTSITVGDLPPGPHSLRIFALSVDRRGRGHEDVVFDGRVKTHNGMATLFVYDYNSDQVDETEQDMNNFPAPPPHSNGQRFRDQYVDDGDNNGAGGYNNNSSNNNYNNNGNGGQPPAAPVATGTLTQAKMDDLKAQVAAKETDVTKTALLKDALKDEKITTSQVSDIMDWFLFESSKVDFAKWAYPITVDHDNYASLENKFQYKASQDDLDGFIKGQK